MEVSSRALIVREPWISRVLEGRKLWEMRSKRTRMRGPICLVRAGSGLVVGVARLVDSLPPLTAADYMLHRNQHCIPEHMLDEMLAARWVHPWVLANVRPLERPVPYFHKGGVTFTTLAPEVVRAVAEQIGGLTLSEDQGTVTEAEERPESTAAVIAEGSHRARPPIVQQVDDLIAKPNSTEAKLEAPVFVFRTQRAQAIGHPTADGGFVVRAGSTALREGSSGSKRERGYRDQLVSRGVLVPDSDSTLFRFSADHSFSSASQAAGVIKDGNASGPQLWKDERTGRTLQKFASASE